MVTLKAPALDKQAVIDALYLLFGQDYKAGGWNSDRDRKFARWKGRGYAAFDEDNNAWPSETAWPEESVYYEADDWGVKNYISRKPSTSMPVTMVRKSQSRTMVRLLKIPMSWLNSTTMPMPPTWAPDNDSSSSNWLKATSQWLHSLTDSLPLLWHPVQPPRAKIAVPPRASPSTGTRARARMSFAIHRTWAASQLILVAELKLRRA